MPCHYPVRAFRIADRQGRPEGISFHPVKGMNVIADLKVPCGQCMGCKTERARQWAIRCMHEAQLHPENCFITLTYNEENLPDRKELVYKEFQSFLKKLRKKVCFYLPSSKHQGPYRKIRYYVSGEYGELKERPHWHACIFGYDFPDKIFFKNSKGGPIFTSKILETLWLKGFSTTMFLTFESAQYAASYIMKKHRGQSSDLDYQFIDMETGEVLYREKELSRMSLKPGIGYNWYQKYKSEVFPFDRVIVKGMEMKPPRYYVRKYKDENPEGHEELTALREARGKETAEDNTEERLLVKERVLEAKINMKARKSI